MGVPHGIKERFKEVKENFPMKELTSFRLGGPADVVIFPHGEQDIVEAIEYCRKASLPYLVIGRGTNLLIDDGGWEGAVITIGENHSKIQVEGNLVIAESGAKLKDVAEAAQRAGLTGLEFAHGIPGGVGGAVTMNAGAYDGETKDVIAQVRVLTKDGDIRTFSAEEMAFRYRRSRVDDEGLVVLSATYALTPGDPEKIQEKMDDLWRRREEKQPLEMPSAGSTFKRPEGYFAGKLIDDAGLRGLRHGGAQISEKHCGFVINRDQATTKDVKELIAIVQKTVKDLFGVELETEVKVIGRS